MKPTKKEVEVGGGRGQGPEGVRTMDASTFPRALLLPAPRQAAHHVIVLEVARGINPSSVAPFSCADRHACGPAVGVSLARPATGLGATAAQHDWATAVGVVWQHVTSFMPCRGLGLVRAQSCRQDAVPVPHCAMHAKYSHGLETWDAK